MSFSPLHKKFLLTWRYFEGKTLLYLLLFLVYGEEHRINFPYMSTTILLMPVS
jgi:hypothetical protein